MTELYFLRHGTRIDHAIRQDPHAQPLTPSPPYDPSLATLAIPQLEEVATSIVELTQAFTNESNSRKNIYIHFSPYLRCCQSADLLLTNLKRLLSERYPHYKVKFLLLGDFAASEWIHDKMKEKPPFGDSNDAYQMYTPNIKSLANRGALSNFRPSTTLGQFNGPNLSYKDYQERCKDYFKKLLATYDKPLHVRNQDIIIVVSHGYLINNFILYFINHPIFDEISEANVNYARRVQDGDDSTWTLFKDLLGLLEREDVNACLNLDTDIVYYKTNFIKKDELHQPPSQGFLAKPVDPPRASFKMTSATETPKEVSHQNNNPICAAARDWTPQAVNQYLIKTEFKLKTMNDKAFRRDFSLLHHPRKPVTPEVSPCSEPTRNNSVIDLSKLTEFKPIKLKYSSTADIPSYTLNSKVNSQVNLAQMQRNAYASSNNSSTDLSLVDLPKYLRLSRKRSLSNPNAVHVVHNKDSYFPTAIIHKVRSSPEKDVIDKSDKSEKSDEEFSPPLDLDIIKEFQGGPKTPGAIEPSHFNLTHLAALRSSPPPRPGPSTLVSRLSSLNYKRKDGNLIPLLAKYQQSKREDSDDVNHRMFSLSFSRNESKEAALPHRKGLLKFVPLVYDAGQASTPTGMASGETQKLRLVFYNLNSDSTHQSDLEFELDLSSEDEKLSGSDRKSGQYIWFGQNR